MKTTLALCLEWRTKRAERLALQKKVDEIEVQEKTLKEKILVQLRKSASKAVSNGDRLFQLVPNLEPKAEDWPKVYAYIQETGEFDLLQRRLNNAAVKERWELKVKIPGVVSIPTETLSDTKAK